MSFPKQLELDALKQRIKETAANLAEMRKQLPAAIAAAKEEGGKPKKTLTPEHLAAMKAGREKKKAEKATSADEASAPEAEEKPKKEKKAKKVKSSADASEVPAEADADAEVKKVKKAKKAKASDSDADADADAEPKVKKAPAAGTLAWHAYVKHMVETRPEAFVDMKQPQKFTVAKGMRAADPSGYEAFVADWKAL